MPSIPGSRGGGVVVEVDRLDGSGMVGKGGAGEGGEGDGSSNAPPPIAGRDRDHDSDAAAAFSVRLSTIPMRIQTVVPATLDPGMDGPSTSASGWATATGGPRPPCHCGMESVHAVASRYLAGTDRCSDRRRPATLFCQMISIYGG